MKVHIGPYTTWIGPYQLADLLKYVGVSEDRCHKIGESLGNTWVNNFCQWIENKKKRKVKIRIDKYDTWSMDHTLALIIVPMLRQLQATKHGSPVVDDADVPEHLRSTAAPPTENEWDTDDLFHKRWEYVLNEMIWAFEQCISEYDWEQQFFVDGFDREGYNAHQTRINKGTQLFGKYYQALWD